MTTDNNSSEIGPLPSNLQARLDVIIRTIPDFWEQKIYLHFTNHGVSHSERVYRLLAQLAQELPEGNRLNADEIFIVSAAVWLYEVGMQNSNLKPTLDFDYRPDKPLTLSQLQEIRAKKHILSKNLIYDSVRDDYKGKPISLGLFRPADKHTFLIAEVCRWISEESLNDVPENDVVDGVQIRVRLLVALLRLADQLYIDSARINLDILETARLPEKEFARWWAYHYIQTLPIINGQLRFHYFLPSHQKEYLGHIRALLEPNFEFDNNSTIRYLWENYRLRLMPPRKPSVSKFDQAPGFQRPMGSELINILRHEIKPIPTVIDELMVESEEEPKERCLLLLDYENFIIQLGEDGHFINYDEMGRLIAKLRTEGNQEHDGPIDCIAIGNWNRPDTAEVSKMLEDRVFDLVNVEPDERERIIAATIEEKIRSTQKPRRIIFVTPSIALGRTIQKLANAGYLVNVWTSNSPDAEIFHGGFGNKFKLLTSFLQLEDSHQLEKQDLEIGKIICIVRFQSSMDTSNIQSEDGLPLLDFSELTRRLENAELLEERQYWWIQWLISSGILIFKHNKSQTFYQLNPNNLAVKEITKAKESVIEIFKNLKTKNQDEVNESELLAKLDENIDYLRHEKIAKQFLNILKSEGLLRRREDPYSSIGLSLWQLNDKHEDTVGYLLPRFILALDHALVKQGFYEFHEHTLNKQLSESLDNDLISSLYRLALSNKWVKRFETKENLYNGSGKISLISPDEYHEAAGVAIRNRNLIIHYFRGKVSSSGIEKKLLWERMKDQVAAFNSSQEECNMLIDQMLQDKIIIEHETDTNGKALTIDLNALITQRLFARFYFCVLVKNLKRIQATKDNKQPLEKLEESLLKIPGINNQTLAWIIEFANQIRLLHLEDYSVEGKSLKKVWLNRGHSFVRDLDLRERIICFELPKNIKQISKDRQGWVPRPVVFAAMNRITVFGTARPEHEFWINQALYRGVIEQERRRGAGDDYYLRAKPTESQ